MSGPNRTVPLVALIVALMVSTVIPAGGNVRALSNRLVTGPTSAGEFAGARAIPDDGLSPHPGQIVYQDLAPGGATSEDPSVAYDTISAEPIWNVYQTLVAYNGGNTSSFVPELSTCVPGPGCAAMYAGNTLIVDNTTTGTPEYWTFPIDRAAHFYDPSTGANWSVYPSDLLFSMSRSCAFADLPGEGSEPGWIQCQALLPYGDASWDSGIHFVFNNTPQHILGSMLINDTTYCPPAVMANSNGCITFNAWAGGTSWTFFLELVADPMGAAAEPCGWFSANAANVTGFPGTNAANGDGPCYLPGSTPTHGITSTNDPEFTSYLAGLSPKYWDNFEMLAMNTPAIQPGVRWHMVGSGPYYLANQPFQPSVGYTLEQNLAYRSPTGCAGQPGCEPLPGSKNYIPKVTVVYETNDSSGLTGIQNGTTDFASVEPSDVPWLLDLATEGKVAWSSVPTLTISFFAFSPQFDLLTASLLDPQNITIPGDFFSYLGVRQFLAHAFPYTTVENSVFTTDGVEYGFNYGGAIPQYMGDYYPTNISWPSGDPISSPTVNGSAAWWWAQATNTSGPYYDQELANCTRSSPCRFPVIGERGESQVDELIQIYLPYIQSLSGGRLVATTFDCVNYCECTFFPCGPPGLPVYALRWGPDYPDPTDYMSPMYYPNSTYTSLDGVEQGLSMFTCPGAHRGPANPASMAGLVYWASQAGIPQACEGTAYTAMSWGMTNAATMPNGPGRVLLYNLVEHIADGLALYVYYDETNTVTPYAPWIDASSVNPNPMIGGAGDFLWYNVRYAPETFPVEFTENGLPTGTNWTVSLNGTVHYSLTNTMAFVEPNGTYYFSIPTVIGYSAHPSSGTANVNNSGVNETIAFTPIYPAWPTSPAAASPWAADAWVAYGVVMAGAAGAVVLSLLRKRWSRSR